ncbi:MAG: hypothetical protein IPN34_15870 [Planctomycetes bacterium]|nr:hypothetical protein [Planctomycetota bacterium]
MFHGRRTLVLFGLVLAVVGVTWVARRDHAEADVAPLAAPGEEMPRAIEPTKLATDPRDAPPTESTRLAPPSTALAPSATDAALAAALGRDGVAEVRILDRERRPLRGVPVLVVPEQTWSWLCADPAGPERYLGNLRASPASSVLRSDEQGVARAAFLPQSGPLRAIAGEGAWVAASSPAFTSGRAESPPRFDLVLYPRAALELRAQGAAGEALPLLSALATPAAESGTAVVRASIDRGRRAPTALRLEPLPAGVACAVEATVLIDGRTRVLRGSAVPEHQRTLVLDLSAETDVAAPAPVVGEEKAK